MTIGAQLMRENAAVMAASEDTLPSHGTVRHRLESQSRGFRNGRLRLDKIGTGGAQAYGWDGTAQTVKRC